MNISITNLKIMNIFYFKYKNDGYLFKLHDITITNTNPCDIRLIFFLNAESKEVGLLAGLSDFLSSCLDFLSLSKYFSKPVGGFSHRFVHCLRTVFKLGNT